MVIKIIGHIARDSTAISARVSFIPAQKQLYKNRTVAERVTAHLMDWLISDQICVQGYKKVSSILMYGVINLAA